MSRLASFRGFYVPSLYDVHYNGDGTIAGVRATRRQRRATGRQEGGGEERGSPRPAGHVDLHARTPSSARASSSRSCAAAPTCAASAGPGYNYLPVRAFPADRILELAADARRHASRAGLVSIALCDHPEIDRILDGLLALGYSISPASLRLDDLTDSIVRRLRESGEKSITIAPETGSDRLRRVINKTVTNDEILAATELIFANGIDNLKLYYMIGLPTETDEDLEAIRDLTVAHARHHDEARPSARPHRAHRRQRQSADSQAGNGVPVDSDGGPGDHGPERRSGCGICSPTSTTSTSTSSPSGIPTTRRCSRSATGASPMRSRPPSATAATGAPPLPKSASTPISTSSATVRPTPCCPGTSSTAA